MFSKRGPGKSSATPSLQDENARKRALLDAAGSAMRASPAPPQIIPQINEFQRHEVFSPDEWVRRRDAGKSGRLQHHGSFGCERLPRRSHPGARGDAATGTIHFAGAPECGRLEQSTLIRVSGRQLHCTTPRHRVGAGAQDLRQHPDDTARPGRHWRRLPDQSRRLSQTRAARRHHSGPRFSIQTMSSASGKEVSNAIPSMD